MTDKLNCELRINETPMAYKAGGMIFPKRIYTVIPIFRIRKVAFIFWATPSCRR
jgi:hypothetical protein